MQGLSAKGGERGSGVVAELSSLGLEAAAVDVVAEQRMPDRGEVDADLVGAPERPRGTIDKPIDRHPRARDKMAVREGGREAITHWEVLERYRGSDGAPVASLIACRLETGRTHQIRVHLASIGHPLLGDDVYGGDFKTKATQLGDDARAALAALGRQALHAYLLGIEHPSQGTNLEFRAELPDDLLRLRHSLGAQGTLA